MQWTAPVVSRMNSPHASKLTKYSPCSEFVMNPQGVEVGVKSTRQGWPNRRPFAVVVIVPLTAESPPLRHRPHHVAKRGLIVRLQRSRPLPRIEKLGAPIHRIHAISGMRLRLLVGREHEVERTILGRFIVERSAKVRVGPAVRWSRRGDAHRTGRGGVAYPGSRKRIHVPVVQVKAVVLVR